MSTEVLNEVIAFEKWWKEHEGLHKQSRYDVAIGVWMAGMSTRRQLEIAVETLKDISEGTQPADLVAEDALDEINKVGGS